LTFAKNRALRRGDIILSGLVTQKHRSGEGLTENTERENNGPSKLWDEKIQDVQRRDTQIQQVE